MQAFKRSKGMCQFCGCVRASEAHHWELYEYPDEHSITPDDLVALCVQCHTLATKLRTFHKAGGSHRQFIRLVKETLKNALPIHD